jgi:acyl-CoA reductase-like NAD-dependent aldehyde dehydrogenase
MDAITRGLLIDGEDIPASGGRTTENRSPWQGELYATMAAASTTDVTRAVDAAATAFESWSRLGVYERRAIFLRAADVMTARLDQAIEVMADEVGAARPWAAFNVNLCVEMLREAAAAITAPIGQILATDVKGSYSMAVRTPVGVVAALSPWNAPYILGTRAIALPLAMGNTVVLKPSEDAPITCGLFIADLLHEAGLPPGVLNVITTDLANAGDVVSALIADPRVRLVNFTGSTKVGRITGIEAAKNLKPAILELGGKNPLVVLKDADIGYAVHAASFGAFMNSGQICICTDRIIVHRDVADEFTAKYADAIQSLPSGDPSDPATVVGPLVNQRAAIRVSSLVKDAVDRGATLLVGTGEVEGPNQTLVRPVVLTDVTPQMDIYYGEIFGSAVVIDVANSVDHAVELANDTEYGLTGGVISENLSEAMDVARRVQTGIMHVNDQGIADEPMAPFGGVKNSGYGRFGGQAGIEAFSATRWITVQAHGHVEYPF